MLNVVAAIKAARTKTGYIVAVNNSLFRVPYGGGLNVSFIMQGAAIRPVINGPFTAFELGSDELERLSDGGEVLHYTSRRDGVMTGMS